MHADGQARPKGELYESWPEGAVVDGDFRALGKTPSSCFWVCSLHLCSSTLNISCNAEATSFNTVCSSGSGVPSSNRLKHTRVVSGWCGECRSRLKASQAAAGSSLNVDKATGARSQQGRHPQCAAPTTWKCSRQAHLEVHPTAAA
jgi:hypothetical protein